MIIFTGCHGRLAAAGLFICLLVSAAPAQVIYNDGGDHLLDDGNPVPNGDIAVGVLVDNGTTVTISDINTNGQPVVGGTGFDFTASNNDSFNEAILVVENGSVVNVQGGTFNQGSKDGDLGVIVEHGSGLNISGGAFAADDLIHVRPYTNSSVMITGGSFMAGTNSLRSHDDSTLGLSGATWDATFNVVVSAGSSELMLTNGTFTAVQINQLESVDESRMDILAGDFPSKRSFISSAGTSTMNLSGGVFTVSDLDFNNNPIGRNNIHSGGQSTLNLDGGMYTANDDNDVESRDGSTLNLRGGMFMADGGNSVSSITDSQLYVSGGEFSGEFNDISSSHQSSLEVTAGEFTADYENYLSSTVTSTLTVAGGTFTGLLNIIAAFNESTINITGGTFEGITSFDLGQSSRLNISGGDFPSNTKLIFGGPENPGSIDGAEAHLFGSDFHLNGVPVDFMGDDVLTLFDPGGGDASLSSLIADEVLTGVLSDGSAFSLNIDVSRLDANSPGRVVLHSPEPAAVAVLSLLVFARPRRWGRRGRD